MREADYIEINVLGLRTHGEVYVFLYDDEHRREALRTLGRFATEPELRFDWYDAAKLSARIRKDDEERKPKTKPLKGQTWKTL